MYCRTWQAAVVTSRFRRPRKAHAMKLASWNVNSLNIRLARLLDWLAANTPDVVCLQETKLEDAKFPAGPLDAAGYASYYAGQKTYNGVAILARHGLEVSDVVAGVD